MTPPKEIWLVESPTAFWFSREPVHDLPDDCVVTHMVPAQPEQEPVASKHYYFEYVGFGRWVKCDKETYDKTPEIQRLSLYTTPPQRKPLTDEEIGAILEGVNAYGTRLYTFARAIEAAHGIKE